MYYFRDEQHMTDYHYLLLCQRKYTTNELNNDWHTTSYIIAGLGVTDLFLSALGQEMSLNYPLFRTYLQNFSRSKQSLCRYALQFSYPQYESISFHQVVQQTTKEDLKLLLHAVDTTYFLKQLS